MRATKIFAPHDIRLVEVPDPTIERPTDAIVRVTAGCICGSDLWNYRGVNDVTETTIGHEAIGVVEEVGAEVSSFAPGDFVIIPFVHCDNTCPNCQNGAQSVCENIGWTVTGQGEYVRATQAEGSLVKTPDQPDDSMIPDLLALSDVMPTGWHAAVSAGVAPGHTTVVIGDGAVGLCGVIAAKELGAERVVVMSRHADRQALAREFGATDIVEERDDEGVQRIRDLTDGVSADSVLECVGTDQSMQTAFQITRAGSRVGFVGVPHGVEVPMLKLFRRNIGLSGGMAPVRRYLPDLLERVVDGRIHPGRVFDQTLPLVDVAEGYRAMDERRAIKVMLRP